MGFPKPPLLNLKNLLIFLPIQLVLRWMVFQCLWHKSRARFLIVFQVKRRLIVFQVKRRLIVFEVMAFDNQVNLGISSPRNVKVYIDSLVLSALINSGATTNPVVNLHPQMQLTP